MRFLLLCLLVGGALALATNLKHDAPKPARPAEASSPKTLFSPPTPAPPRAHTQPVSERVPAPVSRGVDREPSDHEKLRPEFDRMARLHLDRQLQNVSDDPRTRQWLTDQATQTADALARLFESYYDRTVTSQELQARSLLIKQGFFDRASRVLTPEEMLRLRRADEEE